MNATLNDNLEPVTFSESPSVSADILCTEDGPPKIDLIRAGLLSRSELVQMDVPARPNLCGTWLREGDLGFIAGPRGLGKTWFTMYLVNGIASGTTVGPWGCLNRSRCLYVDGEMPLDLMQERVKGMFAQNADVTLLSHEHLFDTSDLVLNLADKNTQSTLTALCREGGFKVLVLDNLSCLFSGVKENDADQWEQVLPWLLQLRRRHVAVIIIHHTGRNGEMRGTSRREDAAFWMIKLHEPAVPDFDQPGRQAQFISKFMKNRQGTADETDPQQWRFTTGGDGTVCIDHKPIDPVDEFMTLINDGLELCSEIAKEMGRSPSYVSKLASRAHGKGLITRDGRRYRKIGCLTG